MVRKSFFLSMFFTTAALFCGCGADPLGQDGQGQTTSTTSATLTEGDRATFQPPATPCKTDDDCPQTDLCADDGVCRLACRNQGECGGSTCDFAHDVNGKVGCYNMHGCNPPTHWCPQICYGVCE